MNLTPVRILVSLGLALLALASPAVAQETEPPRILVIDVQQVMQQSTAVDAIQAQLDERRQEFQAELKAKEQEIREEEQALARQRSILSKEVFAQKRKELEEKVALVQREVQTRQQQLAELQQQGMGRVNEALVQIVQEKAKTRDADLVLGKGAIILVRAEFEITEEVLAELNKRLPSVELPAAQ